MKWWGGGRLLLAPGLIIICTVVCIADSTTVPRLPLSSSESIRTVGAKEWNKLLAKNAEDSCWSTALNRFRELASEECGASQELTKTLLALTLTKCHYSIRLRGFPSPSACPLDDAFKEITQQQQRKATSIETVSRHPGDDHQQEDNPVESPVVRMIAQKCLGGLSESAFEVYIQFFNHIDNICFYMQSTLWQEKTEETVNRLVSISGDVVNKLNEANRQNALLVQQQRVALEHQKQLLTGSEKYATPLFVLPAFILESKPPSMRGN